MRWRHGIPAWCLVAVAAAQTYYPPGATIGTAVELGEITQQGIRSDELPSRDGPSGVRVQWQSFAPAYRDGAYGFIDIELRNESDVPRQVFAETETPDWVASAFGTARSVVLDPGARRRLALPYPSSTAGELELRLSVDDRDDESSTRNYSLDDPGPPCAVLIVAGTGGGSGRARLPVNVSGRGYDPHVHRGSVAQLPAEWAWLSGMDIVVLDHLGPELTAEAADVLADYAAGGGALVVIDWRRLPTTPLRQLCTNAASRASRAVGFGLGQVVAAQPGEADGLIADLLEQAERFPARNTLVGTAPIPGMESVPVKVFFVLVVCFAICVGPLNYWILRRRRRPTVLVVTVPLIGLLFTVGILFWGVFRDGFGIRGAARSFTVFDQAEQQAATVGLRSLYAGIGPAQLALEPGTQLGSRQAYNRSRSYRRRIQSHALLLDADRQVVDGSALPSRFVTSLETTSVAGSRPRLRFARDGDGYRLLASRELAPAEGSAVVLRAPDGGGYFAGTVEGGEVRLAPAGAAELEAFSTDAAERVAPRSEVEATDPRRRMPMPRTAAGLRARIHGLGQGLPEASYLMWAERPPAWDGLGLEVEWLARDHLVLGLCAEEDFDG